jgi:hypothetical protein
MKKSLVLTALLLMGLMLIVGCAEEPVTIDHVHTDGDDHGHEHGEEPYEWSGIFVFTEETYTMEFQESADSSVEIVIMPDAGDRGFSDHIAYHIWEEDMLPVAAGGSFEVPTEQGYILSLNPDATDFTFTVSEAGEYLVYMEHMPHEFDLKFYDSSGQEMVPVDPVE